ncbi:hypothetical protein [Gymnodinialimonas hymeniacidonis]|uniref:hypothetical protein n=1 Tax=Gymnodinialimonas hymeniacidonis TaxID=3126508 RepID=UPI0034C5EE98
MIILSPQTVANAGALETRSLPKKIIGRVQILPRNASLGTWLRLLFEMQFLRYCAALFPFLVPILISRDLALPVMQAPLAMILVIGVIELKVLRLPDSARARLMPEEEADRILDAFAFRAKSLLRRIAARRGIAEGDLRLVAEQSEMARVAPLTFVSVQSATPSPHIVPLDAEDRTILDDLFDDTLTERDLHRAQLRKEQHIQDVRIEATGVSAHARLSAWMDAQAAEA